MREQERGGTVSSISDMIEPTKERCQHNGGVREEVLVWTTDGKPLIKRFHAVWECPLDAYRDHNLISGQEHRAGIKFRSAYYGAILNRKPDFNPTSQKQASRRPTMSEQTLKQAYQTLALDERDVIVTVCGDSHHIWNRSALEKLRRGLGKLAIAWHSAAIEVCEH